MQTTDITHTETTHHKSKVSDKGKILLATVGFFSDAYDLFVVNIILVILSDIYGFGAAQMSIVFRDHLGQGASTCFN